MVESRLPCRSSRAGSGALVLEPANTSKLRHRPGATAEYRHEHSPQCSRLDLFCPGIGSLFPTRMGDREGGEAGGYLTPPLLLTRMGESTQRNSYAQHSLDCTSTTTDLENPVIGRLARRFQHNREAGGGLRAYASDGIQHKNLCCWLLTCAPLTLSHGGRPERRRTTQAERRAQRDSHCWTAPA